MHLKTRYRLPSPRSANGPTLHPRYHHRRYQLSVGYGAQHRQRGAYFDLIWAPVDDVPYLHRMSSLLAAQLEAAKTGKAPPTGSEREQTLLRRFLMGREELGRPAATVLWYASFGDEHAAEPSAPHLPPPRPVALAEVMPPYRELALGEDPIFFERPLCEFVDASSDQVLRDMHDGLVPRAYTSYALPIWPRTARAFKLRFPLERLLREPAVKQKTQWRRAATSTTSAGGGRRRSPAPSARAAG